MRDLYNLLRLALAIVWSMIAMVTKEMMRKHNTENIVLKKPPRPSLTIEKHKNSFGYGFETKMIPVAFSVCGRMDGNLGSDVVGFSSG